MTSSFLTEEEKTLSTLGDAIRNTREENKGMFKHFDKEKSLGGGLSFNMKSATRLPSSSKILTYVRADQTLLPYASHVEVLVPDRIVLIN